MNNIDGDDLRDFILHLFGESDVVDYDEEEKVDDFSDAMLYLFGESDVVDYDEEEKVDDFSDAMLYLFGELEDIDLFEDEKMLLKLPEDLALVVVTKLSDSVLEYLRKRSRELLILLDTIVSHPKFLHEHLKNCRRRLLVQAWESDFTKPPRFFLVYNVGTRLLASVPSGVEVSDTCHGESLAILKGKLVAMSYKIGVSTVIREQPLNCCLAVAYSYDGMNHYALIVFREASSLIFEVLNMNSAVSSRVKGIEVDNLTSHPLTIEGKVYFRTITGLVSSLLMIECRSLKNESIKPPSVSFGKVNLCEFKSCPSLVFMDDEKRAISGWVYRGLRGWSSDILIDITSVEWSHTAVNTSIWLIDYNVYFLSDYANEILWFDRRDVICHKVVLPNVECMRPFTIQSCSRLEDHQLRECKED